MTDQAVLLLRNQLRGTSFYAVSSFLSFCFVLSVCLSLFDDDDVDDDDDFCEESDEATPTFCTDFFLFLF